MPVFKVRKIHSGTSVFAPATGISVFKRFFSVYGIAAES